MSGRKGQLLGSQVEDRLFAYICQDEVEIGSKIPNEFDLAEQFGVGRSTIREAVKSLATKGILEVRRGSGTYVVSKSMPEYDPLGLSNIEDKYKLAIDLTEMRLLIEPEMAAKAAEHATDEEIANIIRLCNEVEALYLSGKDHMKKDVEFHQCIAHSSGNQVVEMLLPLINTSVSTSANITYYQLKQETIDTHRAITNAIASHDNVGARYAMIMHLNYTRDNLRKSYLREHKKHIEENG